MAFTYGTIWGDFGDEKQETSAQFHPLGTKMILPDGRIYYYAENSSAAITTGGQVVDGIQAVVAHDMDLVAAAASAEATSFTTTTSLTTTKDQYAGGYVYINDGPGQGEVYSVRSNTLVSSAAGLSITIEDDGGLATALTTDTRFGLMYSPYKDIKIKDGQGGTETTGVIGVTAMPVTADYFCWVQTSGPAAVLMGAQVAVVGDAIAVSQQDEDGTVERSDYSDESDLANLGTAMGIPAVATDYQWVMLNIRA
jgi:hypothetical protein